MVYLPGLDGTGRLLHRQPRLHERYEVHCVAYPQSTGHTYADLVNLAIPPLERAGGGAVLAESFGGAVALFLALERPDLIERLVLVNTFAYFPRRLLIGAGAFLGRFFPVRPAPKFSRHFRGPFFFSRDIPPAERAEWWDRTADVPSRTYGWRLGLIHGLDLRPRLAEILTPALVLAAPDDRVVPPSAGQWLARALPRGRLLQPLVGHAAMIHPKVDVADLLQDRQHWPGVDLGESR